VVGILGGILRDADAEGAALFHALEDEVDAVSPRLLHAAQCWQDVILFAEAFFGPLHREFVIAGVSLRPVAVIVGAPAEHFLAHHRDAQDVRDEMDDLFGPGQAAEIAVDDDAVEAVVYKKVSRSSKSRVKSFIGLYSAQVEETSGPEDHQTQVGQAGDR